ncbi:tape measure protein [Arthrobacter phage Inked]|nr:tape measure protein [Arthrobacter phage Inked]
MSSIDERVVQMKFDNAQFAKGVADTNSSLDKLKQGLNLEASAKSLDGLNAAGSRFSLAGIAQGVQDLGSKFNALSVIGITALSNITNKAIDAGMQFAKSFTVQPIMDGFNEYELKMGSIQTILANTARHGTSLETVTNEFAKLNEYSDKTIYNFGDMTRNIGLFTASGIKVEDATTMIKGFSNAAATTGTTAAAAAGAAYQLSQSLGDGKITLETWNSLSNAGMGNKNMQEGLIKIADAMGTFTGTGTTATEAAKSFNKSLEKGWLAPDVMSNYLKIMSGDMDDASIAALGLSEESVKAFRAEAKMAEEAATKVRTFTQLVGTLKESVGSGWSETFELLIGDFTEATDLFTKINDTLGGMIGKASKARNDLIRGWAESGGRAELISGLGAAFDALVAVMKVVGQAWSEIFPPITVDTLTTLTGKVSAFLKSLMPGPETLNKLLRIFKGLFAVIDLGWFGVQLLWGVLERLFKGMGGAGGSILELVARFGDFLVKMRETILNSEKLNAFFVGLTPILKAPGAAINWLATQFLKLLDAIGNLKIDTSGFNTGMENLKASLAKLKPTGESVHKVWEGITGLFKKVLDIAGQLGRELGEFFKKLAPEISNGFANINWATVMGMLGTGMLASIALMIKKFTGGGLIQQIKDAFFGEKDEEDDGPGFLDRIKETLGGVTDTLSQMQTTLKAATLVAIAAALALMAYSLSKIAQIDPARVVGALAALTTMMGQLIGAMMLFDRIQPATSIGKLIGLGTAMILLAIAVNILADAVEKLGKLNVKEMLKGLMAVTTLLLGMAVAARIMSTQNGVLVRTGVSMILLAVAIKILASAVGDFGGMDWQKMMQGLIGVGMVLGGLVLFTQLAKANKGAMGSAAGLILLGVAIKILASAVKDFAEMDWQKMMQGLIALGMVLGGLAAFSRLVNPAQMVSMGVSLVIIAASMKVFAIALKDLGDLDWQKMMQGLIAMGIILGGIAVFSRLVNPVQMVGMSVAMVVIAVAMDMMAGVLKKLGGMSWEELQKGLLALGASLVVMALGVNMMVGALPGAAALLVVVAALNLFVPVLQTLGNMSWEKIWTGIGALALSLLTLGVAGVVLGILSPLFMLFGASLILVGTGALLAGAGLMLFGIGLTAVAAAGAAGVTVLVASVTALLSLIPWGMQQLGLGIVELAKVLGENVPAFIEAGVKLLKGLLEGLRQVLPDIASFIVEMIMMILTKIRDNLPNMIQAGFDILVGFLSGIANNIGRVVDSAANIIINFLNALANKMPDIVSAGVNLVVKFVEGIANNIKKVTDAGADLIIKAVNAVADTINEKRGEMQAAGEKLAWAIADGLTGGMASKARNIAAEAWELGKKAIAAIKGAIDSNSPSKESRKLGTYLSQGFALGISDLGHLSRKSSSELGVRALESLKTSIAKAGEGLDGNMEVNPVIRPVLDLSSVKSQSAGIGAMLTPSVLDVTGSYQTAAAIVASQREQARIDAENLQVRDEEVTESVTYIQNLYSPKALPRADIYRGTKNQLSDHKSKRGVLTANAL